MIGLIMAHCQKGGGTKTAVHRRCIIASRRQCTLQGGDHVWSQLVITGGADINGLMVVQDALADGAFVTGELVILPAASRSAGWSCTVSVTVSITAGMVSWPQQAPLGLGRRTTGPHGNRLSCRFFWGRAATRTGLLEAASHRAAAIAVPIACNILPASRFCCARDRGNDGHRKAIGCARLSGGGTPRSVALDNGNNRIRGL